MTTAGKHSLAWSVAVAELERELAEVRKQMEAQKDEWLSWDAKRNALEKDAERYRWLRGAAYVGVSPHAKTCLWTLRGVFELPGRGFDAAIDAAMKGTQ